MAVHGGNDQHWYFLDIEQGSIDKLYVIQTCGYVSFLAFLEIGAGNKSLRW